MFHDYLYDFKVISIIIFPNVLAITTTTLIVIRILVVTLSASRMSQKWPQCHIYQVFESRCQLGRMTRSELEFAFRNWQELQRDSRSKPIRSQMIFPSRVRVTLAIHKPFWGVDSWLRSRRNNFGGNINQDGVGEKHENLASNRSHLSNSRLMIWSPITCVRHTKTSTLYGEFFPLGIVNAVSQRVCSH